MTRRLWHLAAYSLGCSRIRMAETPTTADQWLETIHREFNRESDRAAAIVVAAMLDEALKLLLRKRLREARSRTADLLEGDQAPLHSFSAKIDAAHQLGLISAYMARDLHLVRKIRNEFAHHPLELTFDSDGVKTRVRALDEGSNYNSRNPATRGAIGLPGARWDFLGAAAWMLYHLHREVEEVSQLAGHGPEFGYIDWDRLPEQLRAFLRNDEAT